MSRLSICALVMTSIVTPILPAFADEPAKPEERVALLKTFREEFIRLTPGEGKFPAKYTRGDATVADNNQQGITLKKPFSVAKYEVPQNLWLAVMGNNPSKWQGKREGGEWTGKRNSAEMMTWDEAIDFCRKATMQMREAKLIGEKEVIRLPSEAEWEYAARAGTTTVYSFGDDADKLGEFGWFTGNAAGNDPPVGAKKPNAWGLYDMHGYLWEFCSDGWSTGFDGAPSDGSPRPAADENTKSTLR